MLVKSLKFIRFAEWKIQKAGFGIVGIITNNSFLDGITHRQMRKHLLETFDEIYIVNLHGNNRKGEVDKNIFDIMVGVNITFLVKHKEPLEHKKVFYYSTLDNGLNRREEKLEFLENAKLSDIAWQELNPSETKNYWFIDKDLEHTDSYDSFWKVTDIFEKYSSCISTANDNFCVHYNKKSLDILRDDIRFLSENEIATKYNIKDGRDWKITLAKKDLIENYNNQEIIYRPFDIRFTSLSKKSSSFLDFPRYEIMQHFDNRDNLGIIFRKSAENSEFWQHIFITKNISEGNFLSARTYALPLYLYTQNASLFESGKTPNWTSKFTDEYLASLSFTPRPEQIMAYIYAVLHSQIYREKYITFLKTDFPAVPMTKDFAVFDKFAKQGQKLINLHLMNEIPDDKDIKISLGGVSSDFTLKKITPPTHLENKLVLTTTENQVISFDNITKEIYDFEIGSYKPIDKWLKYRIKDNVLLNVFEDITHIKNMIIIIKNTIAIMEDINSYSEDYLQ